MSKLKASVDRLAGDDVGRRELRLLLAAVALGLAIRVVYVAATHDHTLAGDEPEYHLQGIRATEGKWFWTDRPFGIEHAGMWKAPAYPALVGVVYSVLGVSVAKLLLLQTVLLGPLVIFLSWLLARRLFDARVALAVAFVAAIYPHMWQWEGRLYAEALALPLGLVLLVLVIERRPTPRLAALIGVVMGASLLARPSSFFFFAGVAVAWWMAAGWRRGTLLLGLSIVVAVLVVAPWTARNYRVADAFIPISLQDAAAYGTFNDEAANDPRSPYAWRVRTAREADLFGGPPIPDAEFRDELQRRARDYVEEHPSSVPKAFFWNGLSRTWDVRRPQYAIDEVRFEGRNKTVSIVGMAMYYPLLLLALAALWRLRSRRTLVLPLLAMALAASVVFTTIAATRYRVPLEPMIVILACSEIIAILSFGRPATARQESGAEAAGPAR